MNNYLLFAIAALGVATTIQYFFGLKKNRWLGKTMSVQAENLLAPKNKEYVNIGGAIGHNFTYKLREPWKEAKGTFTLFPRHSLLYMPFSLLIGGSDRFSSICIPTESWSAKRISSRKHTLSEQRSRISMRCTASGSSEVERRSFSIGAMPICERCSWRPSTQCPIHLRSLISAVTATTRPFSYT